MILKPFHVKSDDGKTFYSDTRTDRAARCNDTAPVAPIGDAEVFAKAVERRRCGQFEWTDAEFEIWWNKDDRCNREKLIEEARFGLTALLAAVAAQGDK